MKNPDAKRKLLFAVSIGVLGVLTKKAVKASWKAVRKKDQSLEPDSTKVNWGETIAMTITASAIGGLTKLALKSTFSGPSDSERLPETTERFSTRAEELEETVDDLEFF